MEISYHPSSTFTFTSHALPQQIQRWFWIHNAVIPKDAAKSMGKAMKSSHFRLAVILNFVSNELASHQHA